MMRTVVHIAAIVFTGVLAYLSLDSIEIAQSTVPSHMDHDRPGEADRHFYGQRLYPDGIVPSRWYESAAGHIQSMPAAIMKRNSAAWNWVSLGPTNVSGRVRALAMNPSNPDVLYAGSAGGGVWKSVDAGRQWNLLSAFFPNLRIGSLAVNPHDPSIVLAGSGEGFVAWQGGIAYGRGMYRSSDAGASWALIPSTENPQFEFVFDISFDPFDENIILASTHVGIMRSSDRGTNWTRLRLTFSDIRGMMSVFSRTRAGLVFSAIERVGIFRSTDHGETWAGPLFSGIDAGQFSRIQLALAPSDGDVVYAAFTSRDESCAGIFRSSDAGQSWFRGETPVNEITGVTYMAAQGSFNSSLSVHPHDPMVIWAGGVDLYRSTDGAATWKQISNWYPHPDYPIVHADHHAIVFHPDTPERVFIACDGGVFRTTDGGRSFHEINTGLVNLQFHSGTPHPVYDMVLGGTIDNGTLRLGSGTLWEPATGGDGGFTAIDYDNPAVMYSEIYYLWFFKSEQFGEQGTFTARMNGIPRSPEGWSSDRVSFIAPFVLDSNNPQILYAGTYRIYKTTDGAGNWSPVSQDISGNGVLTAIGVSKLPADVVYTGSSSGAVHISTDGGGTWRRMNTGLPNRYVTDIEVDPRNASSAFITFSGFGSDHIFKTTNYGLRWRTVSGSGSGALPDVPANCVAVHPSDMDLLFAGTDVGIFQTVDGGDTWSVRNDGMGNVTIADLQFRKDGVLFAATHGRGAWRSNISLTDSASIESTTSFDIGQCYPHPVTSATNLRTAFPYTLAAQAAVHIVVFDARGRIVGDFDLGIQDAGVYRHIFDGSRLFSGLYYYRYTVNGAESGLFKMVVIR